MASNTGGDENDDTDDTKDQKKKLQYEKVSKKTPADVTNFLKDTAKPTVPCVSTSRQTALVNLPLDILWKLIRSCNFQWQKSIVAKTDTIGSSKIIHYLDKTQQTIQITEVSDRDYRIGWSMVASDPPVTYTSRDDTICLTALTAPKGATFIEWNSEFSSDVSIDVIMDGNLKKRDAFKDLTASITTTLSSIDILQNPKFETTKEFEHMAGGEGSKGAYLLTTEVGKMVVKPGSNAVDYEIFAHFLLLRLSNLLKTDCTVPNMRVLRRGADISKECIRKISVMHPKVEDSTPIGHYLAKCQALMLMDFCPGHQLGNPEKFLTEQHLLSLGNVLVFDLLINNWDRIPLGSIWTNRGNPANIIFTDSKSTILIDQTVTPILHQGNKNEYMKKVKQICNEARVYAASSSSSDCSHFTASLKKVRQWITLHSGIDIGDDGEKAVRQGFCSAVEALSNFHFTPTGEGDSSFNSFIKEVSQETFSTLHEEKKSEEKKSNIPFYCDVCSKKCKKKKKYDKHMASTLHKMGLERKQQEEAAASVITPEMERLNVACKFTQDAFLSITTI